MPVPTDRRARKRAARRDTLLAHAADLVDRDGVDGLTMASLAEAADYAPASLYTYFSSRSELLAALQSRALQTLSTVAQDHLDAWDRTVATSTPRHTNKVASLAALWAFSDLFLSAPAHHRREFRLQQQLLVTPGAEETADAASVVPAAMAVLQVPRQMLQRATDCGALEHDDQAVDPLGSPIDADLLRTIAWIVALNGALLVDELRTGLPTTGVTLGNELTGSLLRGWGADQSDLEAARALADALAREVPPGSATPNPHEPGTTTGGTAR